MPCGGAGTAARTKAFLRAGAIGLLHEFDVPQCCIIQRREHVCVFPPAVQRLSSIQRSCGSSRPRLFCSRQLLPQRGSRLTPCQPYRAGVPSARASCMQKALQNISGRHFLRSMQHAAGPGQDQSLSAALLSRRCPPDRTRGTIAKIAAPAAHGPSARLDAFGASHACIRSMRDAVSQLPVSKICCASFLGFAGFLSVWIL